MYNYVMQYRNPHFLPDYLRLCGEKKIPWNWKLFDYFSILLILSSSLNAAIVVRYDEETAELEYVRPSVLRHCVDAVFFVLLFLEIVIRIRGFGFLSGKNAYLRNPFNVIDLFVLITWVLGPAIEPALYINRTWRTFRTLRILYIFRDCIGINLLWKTLKTSISTLVPVTVVIVAVVLYLATAGLIAYTRFQNDYCLTAEELANQPHAIGGYIPCFQSKTLGTISCLGNETMCEEWRGEVHLELVVFTNIWRAMFVVFQLMTLEGWSSIAHSLNHKFKHVDLFWPYLILIILFGSCFALNLIAGVILTEYKRAKRITGLTNGTETANNTMDNYSGSINDNRIIREVSSEYTGHQDSNSFDNKYYQHYGNFMNELQNFIENFWIKKLILVFILINTFILALRRHNESLSVTLILQHLETMFVALFLIETLMKLLTSRKSYFSSVTNCIDFVTINLSVIFFFKYTTSFGLTACRLIHVFDLFDYTSYAERFHMFARAFKSSFKSHLAPLCLVFSVAIVVFVTIGIDLFSFEDLNQPPYYFVGNFLITFQIMSGESWTLVMQKLVSVAGVTIFRNWYCVLVLLTGKYVLLNFLLAYNTDIVESAFIRNRKSNEHLVVDRDRHDSVNKVASNQYDPNSIRTVQNSMVDEEVDVDTIAIAEEHEETGHAEDDPDPLIRQPFLPCNSLFIFSRKNWLRKGAHYVVNLHYFDMLMMYTVLINAFFSCCLLPPKLDYVGDKIFFTIYVVEFILKVIDTGLVLHNGSYLRNVWNVIDLLTIVPLPFLYVLELTTDDLNSRIGISEAGFLYSIRFIRLFRVFTLARKYFPNLRPAFQCVLKSLKYFPMLLIVYFVLHLMFSLIAVHLFGNRVMICEQGATSNREFCRFEISESTGMDYDGYAYEEVSSNDMDFKNYLDDGTNVTLRFDPQNTFHFDNVWESMITLFAIQSGQDWLKITEYLTNFGNHTVVSGPVASVFNPLMVLFYLVYLVIFSFFFAKLFTALVITTYCKEKVSKFEKFGLNKNQTDCIDYVLKMKSYHKYIPSSDLGVRRKAWNVVTSSGFDQFIYLVIILNGLMFIMNLADYNTRLLYLLINLFITAVYVIECVLKIIAFKCGNYFSDWWNALDFVIVLSSLIDLAILIPLMLNKQHYTLLLLVDQAFVLNFLKTLRLFRLVKHVKSMYTKRVLFACKKSFKSLLHIFFPLGVLIMVYASVGENVFRCYNNTHLQHTATTINAHFHFFDIIGTVFLLIRTATGEHWMWTMKHSSPIHVCGHTSSPFGSIFTHIYFISFVFLSTHLMMNLFPAMIVDNFSNLLLDNSVLGEHNLDEFVTSWMEYDPKATRKIHFLELIELLKRIAPPLGLGRYCSSQQLHRKMLQLHIPVGVDGKVGYKVSLFALIRASLDIRNSNLNVTERKKTDDELRKTLRRLWPHIDQTEIQLVLPNMEHDQLTISKIYAGRVILDYWRRRRVVELE